MGTSAIGTPPITSKSAIYIVDGDEAVREGLCRLVASAGCEALAFPDVARFITESARVSGGCILLDSSLLRSEADLTPALLQRRFGMPIIILCAGDDEVVRRDWRRCGASFVLRKPVDAQALFDSIAWVTENN
jgi:FixJ family two-component response regulator